MYASLQMQIQIAYCFAKYAFAFKDIETINFEKSIWHKSYVAKVVCTYRDFKDNELLKMSGDENTRT